jgi:hypothetical protein
MGAPFIRFVEFSVFNKSPRPSVMALIKGYFDDSQTTGRFWALGGYTGGAHHWERFEELWPPALAAYDVPYFHMKEMGDPNGVYAKWHPPQKHEAERGAFLNGLAAAITGSGLRPFSAMVRIDDLNRFNREKGLEIQPYPLAAYTCMLLVGRDHPGIPCELIFDHLEKVSSKLATAREYADSDRYYAGTFDKIVAVPLPKEITFREVPALQAADFSVWEYRKHHLNINDWYELERPRDLDEASEHLKQWSLSRFGREQPPVRKSAVALLENVESYEAIVWDYDHLCTAHDLRGGVWA